MKLYNISISMVIRDVPSSVEIDQINCLLGALRGKILSYDGFKNCNIEYLIAEILNLDGSSHDKP